MKNKEYNYIIIVIISLIIFAIINFLVYGFNSLDDKIINKRWYHYDYITGYYDILTINKDNIDYNSSNNDNSYENCYTYNFDKKKNIINLDCGKKIEIQNRKSNFLKIKTNGYEKTFFDNLEDSLNYEFKSFYGKTIIDYKDEKLQVLDYSKINSEKLENVFYEKGYSKIVFIGNNCTSIDCTLSLDIMEKWIVNNNNIYFYDSNEINNDLLNRISKKIDNLSTDLNFYNGVYPKVLIIKNQKIIDSYDIKCNGFNCNKLYKNEF